MIGNESNIFFWIIKVSTKNKKENICNNAIHETQSPEKFFRFVSKRLKDYYW